MKDFTTVSGVLPWLVCRKSCLSFKINFLSWETLFIVGNVQVAGSYRELTNFFRMLGIDNNLLDQEDRSNAVGDYAVV